MIISIDIFNICNNFRYEIIYLKYFVFTKVLYKAIKYQET